MSKPSDTVFHEEDQRIIESISTYRNDQRDKDEILTIVEKHGWALRYAPPLFKYSEEICVAAVKSYPLVLEFISPEMRENEKVVKQAVTLCGMALLFATAKMRNRKDVVMKAVQNCGLALEFAHPDQKKQPAVVFTAMQQCAPSFHRLVLWHMGQSSLSRRSRVMSQQTRQGFEMEDLSSETSAAGPIWHFGELGVTLKQEMRVCSKVWLWLLAYFVVMQYTSSVLFRNLAFARYEGLEVYAEKVAPHWARAPVESEGMLLTNGVSAVPLSKALEGSPYSHGWNVSIDIQAPRTNLSALGNAPFNLRDISQEYLPDFSHDQSIALLSEVVAGSSIVIWVLITLLPLFVSFPGKQRPFLAAMALRTLRAIFVMHILRIPTYLATTLPGAAPHCQSVRWPGKQPRGGWEENQKHLRTVWDVFFDTYNFTNNSNCGDLVFSGHTVTTATLMVAACYYAGRMLPQGVTNILIVASIFILLLQVFLIVTVHNHYTVDVVIAAYIAPLNFWAWLHLLPTEAGADCNRSEPPARGRALPLARDEAV